MPITPQVNKEHYLNSKYNSLDRWIAYWNQIEAILKLAPQNVLEIGPGSKVVGDFLKKMGVEVTTLDIDPSVSPDIIASVTAIPAKDNAFETILAAEILEHIPFEQVPAALQEIHRVTKRYAVITLPHPGPTLTLRIKLPFLNRFSCILKCPMFWQTHKFNGEHYWEIGKRETPLRLVKRIFLEVKFKIVQNYVSADDHMHRLFVLEKTA